ncbi:MAG: GvpL/GvpF family gas vesicle protein [Chloroflexi bacterium]|nr:GvpL/GvpF family gas vesicle protein [Chloroflexota bacterium]
MADQGKYLYCIVRCSEARTFEDVAAIGDAPGLVHTLPLGSLAAVVSDSQGSMYETTRANMLAHQRVQERVLKELPLLPVRFGAVAGPPSPVAQVLRLLEKRGQEFEELLEEMAGNVELGLKALWRDEQAVFAEIVAENPAIRRLRAALEGKPPLAVHYERIRLGEMVKEALNHKRDVEAARLLGPLKDLARRTVESPVFVDRMVANAAFLVDRAREPDFDDAVRKLDEGWGHRMRFKYVGHVPPYNFVNIAVNWQEL